MNQQKMLNVDEEHKGRDRFPQRSGDWNANAGAHGRLENRTMVGHSRGIRADRPEVGPCL